MTMVLAEKIITAVQRGTANTRWRDFADIYLLIERHDVDGQDLATALAGVAEYREAPMQPLHVVLEGFADQEQRRWSIWRRKNNIEIPSEFAAVLARVIDFADPMLTGAASRQRWRFRELRWS
jgi:hypothetical protein